MTKGLMGIRVWAGASLMLLLACGERGGITDAINASLSGQKTCFGISRKGPPAWPLRVNRGIMGELNPVLSAMQNAGYVRLGQEQSWGSVIDVITPTDEARGWWDESSGWCVGSKTVAEVSEWTTPGSGMPMQAKFTWKLKDVPKWARSDAFASIPGMSKPVEDFAIIQKTNKGWSVAF